MATLTAAILIASAGAILSPTVPHAAAATAQPDASQPADDTSSHFATLRDATAERARREAAAESLVRLSHRPQVAQGLIDLLRDDEQHELRGPILRAIARVWSPPARLFPTLVELVNRLEPQRAVAFMPAIGAYATRDAAQVLVGFLATEHPSSLRDAAASALIRMTGRDDLRSDPVAWSQWLSASRGLNDLEWRELLAEGVWRRADRADADRRALAERLGEGYRRLYIVTPVDERPRLLSQMMLDARPELRDVGLEIVSRELAAGKTMDAPVADAAVRLLRATDARVRARAASLVSQLGATSAAPLLVEALELETDFEAARALLQAIARAPDATGVRAVLRWLVTPETHEQAVDAILSLHRAGHLANIGDQETVLAVLRATEASRLTVSGVRLLAMLGQESDRERLAPLLSSSAGSAKIAAAEALAEFPEHVSTILDAAHREPALFTSAVRAVAAWQNTFSGLRAISDLPSLSPQEYRAGLLQVGAALPIVDLLAAASSTSTDLTLREALLARVLERPMGPFLPGHEEDLATLGECILLLAETRLALKRPDRALAALEALPTAWNGYQSPRTVRLRLIALLWTNRIAAAADLNAPAQAWLDALELAIDEAHAPAIAQEIRRQWPEQLPAEEQLRFDSLVSQLPTPAAHGQRSPVEELSPEPQ